MDQGFREKGHGRSNETDCLGGITYAHWENWGDSHPKAWVPEVATASLCGSPRAHPCAHHPCTLSSACKHLQVRLPW